MTQVTQWATYPNADSSRDTCIHSANRQAFDEAEKAELIDFLAENRLAGDEIPGTGGVRKVRFAASGRGKRGGARIIYYFFLYDTLPLFALLAYAKNAKTDMTPDEKRAVLALTAELKKAWKAKK